MDTHNKITDIKSLINELPNIEDAMPLTSMNPSRKENFTETISINYGQLLKNEPETRKITPLPVSPGKIEYIHVNGITYQNGTIQYQNLINPKDAPLYSNMPEEYWDIHRKSLSIDDIQNLINSISSISLRPLYEAMLSDPYGATPGFCGASYKIFEIRYNDGQQFRFEMHRSIPKEYFNIEKILFSFCK